MNNDLKDTLVLCDLDHLLLDANGGLPQVLRDVMQLFASRGGRLTVFSQRSPRAVRTLLGSVRLAAPALVCGGTLGAAVGTAFAHLLPASFGIQPAAFALVGMAGFLASSIRTPMAAIVMVAEISGNHGLLVPAMWVCGISFWLNNGWSLYRSQPHSRESSPARFVAPLRTN